MKTVFTTGEAAKICKVSQQTIIRCFDSGQLKGFRVPGSRFRRIPRDQLYSFMRDNGIPTDALDSGKRKILVVDDDEQLVELIVDALERELVETALRRTEGNQTRAAELLGLSRFGLQKMMKRLEVEPSTVARRRGRSGRGSPSGLHESR